MGNYFTLYKATFSKLSAAERFIYSYIEYFSRKSACMISREALAERLNISPETVKKAVQKLKRHGLIEVHAKSAGKHKTINTYTIDRSSEQYQQLQETGEQYPTIRVSTEAVQVFGPTFEAILYSVFAELTEKSLQRGESDNTEARRDYLNQGYVHYGVKALAYMCGASARTVMKILHEWESAGLLTIEESMLCWKATRHAYLLKTSLAEFAKVKKIPVQNDEGEKNTRSNPDEGEKNTRSTPNEGEKNTRNELITSESISFSSECSLQSKASECRAAAHTHAAAVVENSPIATDEQTAEAATTNEATTETTPKSESAESVLQAFMHECELNGFESDAAKVKKDIETRRIQARLADIASIAQ